MENSPKIINDLVEQSGIEQKNIVPSTDKTLMHPHTHKGTVVVHDDFNPEKGSPYFTTEHGHISGQLVGPDSDVFKLHKHHHHHHHHCNIDKEIPDPKDPLSIGARYDPIGPMGNFGGHTKRGGDEFPPPGEEGLFDPNTFETGGDPFEPPSDT